MKGWHMTWPHELRLRIGNACAGLMVWWTNDEPPASIPPRASACGCPRWTTALQPVTAASRQSATARPEAERLVASLPARQRVLTTIFISHSTRKSFREKPSAHYRPS